MREIKLASNCRFCCSCYCLECMVVFIEILSELILCELCKTFYLLQKESILIENYSLNLAKVAVQS